MLHKVWSRIARGFRDFHPGWIPVAGIASLAAAFFCPFARTFGEELAVMYSIYLVIVVLVCYVTGAKYGRA